MERPRDLQRSERTNKIWEAKDARVRGLPRGAAARLAAACRIAVITSLCFHRCVRSAWIARLVSLVTWLLWSLSLRRLMFRFARQWTRWLGCLGRLRGGRVSWEGGKAGRPSSIGSGDAWRWAGA